MPLAGAATWFVSSVLKRPLGSGGWRAWRPGLAVPRGVGGKELFLRCARPRLRKVLTPTLTGSYIRAFSPGPPFERVGQWEPPPRTPRLQSGVKHPGTRSKPLEISFTTRAGDAVSCVCFVFRGVCLFPPHYPLDFLLEGRSLSSPRWDKGFGETQFRGYLFYSFSSVSATPSMAVPETRPNHTIYINNLNEKIKKDGEFWK